MTPRHTISVPNGVVTLVLYLTIMRSSADNTVIAVKQSAI